MDHASKGLLFKEWKMMKGFFVGQFVVAAILMLISSFNMFTPMEQILVEIITFGFVIIPATLLFSLNTEVNQMEVFLHNPNTVHKLLLTKFLYSFLSASVFLLLLIVSITAMEMLWDSFIMTAFDVFRYLLYTSVQMLLISLFIAVLLLFFWTMHQILRTYVGGMVSIIAVVVLLAFVNWLFNLFQQTDLFEFVTHWGLISFPYQQPINLIGFAQETIYIGVFIFYGIIGVVLYLVSAYLLDHKVEV